MCKRAIVVIGLMIPHLKDDYFTEIYQYIKFKHPRLEVVFLLAPKMMGRVFSQPFFKSWQSGGKANPRPQLPI